MLDSSIAKNRRLRHFFTDLLLCSDADGNVVMTKDAIANRIRATLDEVEWGLKELMKPDPESLTPDFDGRRIVPLDGHGYGWKIVNYTAYRDIKSDRQKREETAQRVRDWRAKKREKEAAANGPAVDTLRGQINRKVAQDPLTKANNSALRKLNSSVKRPSVREAFGSPPPP